MPVSASNHVSSGISSEGEAKSSLLALNVISTARSGSDEKGVLRSHAAQAGEVIVRLEVDETLPGGLAIYGSRFGRYPLDPTVLFVLR